MTQKNILVIKHGAFGDLIQSFGALQGIREYFTDARITLLTAPAYADLMQDCPFVDALMFDRRRPWWDVNVQLQLKKQLKQGAFSLVIDLQNSDRTRWYRVRWFRNVAWWGRGFFAPAPISGLRGLEDLLQQHQVSIVHMRQPEMAWLLKPQAETLFEHQLLQPYVVLIPGSSSQHPEKRWPHYAALATMLMQKQYQVVAVLGPDESALASALPCKCLHKLSWKNLASVFAYALGVVGNDTGPSHLAARVGAAGLALFGPTTSAQRAEIATEKFFAWQVADLQALTAEQVMEKLQFLSKIPL